MRLQQYINELFDTDVDIKVNTEDFSTVIYEFEIDGIKFEFNANNENGTWEIIFSGKKRSTGITGTGNAPQVFAGIAKCTDMFLKKYKPIEFYFSAKERSRVKLYKRFSKVITKKYPYVFRLDKNYDDGEDMFVFTNKKYL